MLSRFERFNQTRKDKDHRSKLEDEVEKALLQAGPDSHNTSQTSSTTPFIGGTALTSRSGTSTSK